MCASVLLLDQSVRLLVSLKVAGKVEPSQTFFALENILGWMVDSRCGPLSSQQEVAVYNVEQTSNVALCEVLQVCLLLLVCPVGRHLLQHNLLVLRVHHLYCLVVKNEWSGENLTTRHLGQGESDWLILIRDLG